MAIFCFIAAGRVACSIYPTNIEFTNLPLNICINNSIKAAISCNSRTDNSADIHLYSIFNITINFNIAIGYI